MTVNHVNMFTTLELFHNTSFNLDIINNKYFTVDDQNLLITIYDFFYVTDLNVFQNKVNSNLNSDLFILLNTTISSTDNLLSIYTYSVPSLKLYYPEPFIATGNFLHNDIWFIHISIYQYWLWFFFIFLIIFFTISFLVTLRWNIIRNKPQRETRGVSRSKCGDLITAVVPISWAGSIIVHESTDAIDFYDGFGTSEMAIGVRAYQWGWEYYYPKDIDLFYNTTNFNNSFVGNSLFYSKDSDDYSSISSFFEQHKIRHNWDSSITPAHLICFSTTFTDNLNLVTTKNYGYSKLLKQNAFRHILSSRYVHYNLNLNYNKFNNNNYLKTLPFLIKNINIDPVLTPNLHIKQTALLPIQSLAVYHKYPFDLNAVKKLETLNLKQKQKNNAFLNSILLLSNNINIHTMSYEFIDFINNNNIIFYAKNNNNNIKITNDINSLFKKNQYKNYFNVNLSSFSNKISNNYDKYYFNIYDIKQLNENFIKLILNTKKSNTEWINFNEINQLNIKSNTNISNTSYNLERNTNKSTNYLTSVFNMNSVFKAVNLNYCDFTNVDLQLVTNTIVSNTRTPFKFDNLFNNVYSLNNYMSASTIWSSVDNWNNDYFTSPYINKYMKNIFKNYKINSQVNAFMGLIENKQPLPNLFYEVEFKRKDANLLYNEEFWNLYYNYNEYEELENYITDSFSIEQTDEKVELVVKKNITKNTQFINLLNFNDDFNINLFKINVIQDYSFFIKNQYNFFILKNKFNTYINDSFCNFKELCRIFNNYKLNINMDLNLLKMKVEPQILLLKFWNDSSISDLTVVNYTNLQLSNETLNTFQFNTDISLIDSIKTLVKMETALSRFYKMNFDDNRSFINFFNFASSNNKIPFLTSSIYSIKKYINKNYISFLKTNIYLLKKNKTINNNLTSLNSTFLFTFDFPFTVSVESDVLKFSWFDWYSNYNRRVVKQQDLNDHIVNGAKQFTHKYDFSINTINNFNNKDNYLSRLSHSRKNYLPSWQYTPFILTRLKQWTNDHILFTNLKNLFVNEYEYTTTQRLIFNFKFMSWFFNSNVINQSQILTQFTGTNSGLLAPSRNYIRSVNTLSAYTYFISNLIDIMTKREYMLKQLLNYYNVNASFNNSYVTSPYNTILIDFKANFLSNYFTEAKLSEITHYNTNQFILKTLVYNIKLNYFIKNLASTLTKNSFINKFIISFTDIQSGNYTFDRNLTIFKKTQYKHMRKSMSNMIRIQNDKAVAMPVDTRIQFLTVSKDIIHSWAIPSAGIKIDCIPGYSSHKITIFFLSGIYWGQCMEICGRYHHWMPIVVYFMKRDLFLLWCIHFVSSTKKYSNISSSQIVKNNTDLVSKVSYPTSSWVLELTK